MYFTKYYISVFLFYCFTFFIDWLSTKSELIALLYKWDNYNNGVTFAFTILIIYNVLVTLSLSIYITLKSVKHYKGLQAKGSTILKCLY